MSFDRGSEIVLLQDRIFARMPSTPVAFLELDLEMKVCILSGVTGLNSKVMGVGTEFVWFLLHLL